MSKASTASAKTPTQLPSAWAKGPPSNSNSSAPSPRSQSPALSHAPPPITASHSRRPSALGQGVPIKEGVSVPRSNVGSVRQGTSSSAPLSLLVSILIPHPRFCRHFRFHRRSVSSLVIFTCSHTRGQNRKRKVLRIRTCCPIHSCQR
jgi:hypothetical protein